MKSGLEGRNKQSNFVELGKNILRLNEVRPRRPEQMCVFTPDEWKDTVSMKSGLAGRNKRRAASTARAWAAVSMKSGLEGRNNTLTSAGLRIQHQSQ